ncbi:ATP-binding cassette domain-containing protein [Oenococcus sp.]|uniref:ATP-binding cassette domain-containing protein n=1 Tax=Oenococcus sp. TaxID=1979414 RepID=UPI0039EBDBFD
MAQTQKSLFTYLNEHKSKALELAAINFTNSALQTLGGIASANALTVLVAGHFQSFLLWIMIMLVSYLLFALGMYFSIYALTRVKQAVNTSIRRDITERIAQSSYGNYHQRQAGDYSSWMSNDLSIIDSEGVENFFAIVTAITDVVLASLTLAYFHYSILITVFVLSIVMMVLPKIFQKALSQTSLKRTQANERLMSRIEDLLEGFNALFMLNARSLIVAKTVAASKETNHAFETRSKVFGKMMATVNGMGIISQVIVLAQAGFLIFLKLTPIGAVSAAQYFSGIIFSQLTGISANWAELKATAPIMTKFTDLPTADKTASLPTAAPFHTAITIQQVDFSYQGKSILHHLDLTIKKGAKYALIGPSGAGKSTLLALLATKLTDYQGRITLDDHDYKALDPVSIRNQLYELDQDPYIFNDSLKNNITMAQPVSQDLLQSAIDQAGLADLIKSLPDGPQTQLAHNGSDLSGGQKQRIVLAHGLVSGRSIFLVDEGTSALGPASADQIENSLINDPAITLLMVTHHLKPEIANRMDRVFTIQNQQLRPAAD